MPRKTRGNIVKKSGCWYMRISFYDENGKRRQLNRTTGLPAEEETREAAAAMMESLIKEVSEQRGTPDANMEMSVLMKRWLRQKKDEIRRNTFYTYKLQVEAHIVPYFKKNKKKVKEITGRDLTRFYQYEKEHGLSGQTIQRHHSNSRQALDYAVDLDIIDHNPAMNARLPKRSKFDEAKALTAEEGNRLLKISQSTGYEAPVRLALLLGLRKSEALGLRWSDIDFDKKTVTIQNAVVRIGSKEEDSEMTKNKTSRRTLILPDSLYEYLKDLKKKNEEKHIKTDYICCWPDGRRIGSDWLSSSFKTFLRKNGLPEVRFHDLRHTAASLLLSNGLELKDVSSYLGHSTIVTTADIYGHLDSKRTGKIANGINDIFSNISQNKDVFLLIFLPFVSFFVSLFDII